MPDGSAEHVDVVIVGSGFGGSVTAYRMAEAGKSVVVLERGSDYPPGSFARSPHQMSRNFWDPSAGHHGLYDVWDFDGIEGVVSAGLGGGSLIYANVLLRKDPRWFVHDQPVPGGGYESWPIGREDLDPHYDVVEEMLGAAPYPYDDTPKTRAMEDAAKAAGLDIERPPLAVSFATAPGAAPVPGAQLPDAPYGNVHGRPRLTCRLCGECDVGCNDGAKNTLDHTYLSAAAHHGADLRTRHEVRGFRPLAGGGYEVRYVVHGADDECGSGTGTLPTQTLTCDRLVLGAGTFGTTYLLLRNRAALPGISPSLGTRFSGNGDLLTFLMNAGRGGPDGRLPLQASRGPVITTAVRVADEADGNGASGRGHYVQDAGYPGFADWLVETAQLGGQGRRAARFVRQRVWERVSDSADSSLGGDIAELIGPADLSNGSLPLLGMGRDVPDGRLHLHNGRLACDWTTKTSEEYFEGVRTTMKQLADQMGADFHDNPLWLFKRVITVHPLGGSPMGRHSDEGVCDSEGRVFGFPGLYVVDGALMPGPVGANPSLTIAATADRACDAILAEGPMAVQVPRPRSGQAPAPASSPPAAEQGATQISFTEQMKGFVALGVADPREGFETGRALGHDLMFELTISTDDVERFVDDPAHPGSATGFVKCDALGGRFEVERGWFNLFVAGELENTRRMDYRLWLTGAGGNPLTFAGHKEVQDHRGLDVWKDTSTLYLRILDGHLLPAQDDDATTVAAGVITIHVPDFIKQLTTFRGTGERPRQGLAAFGRLFLGELWDVYGPELAESDRS